MISISRGSVKIQLFFQYQCLHCNKYHLLQNVSIARIVQRLDPPELSGLLSHSLPENAKKTSVQHCILFTAFLHFICSTSLGPHLQFIYYKYNLWHTYQWDSSHPDQVDPTFQEYHFILVSTVLMTPLSHFFKESYESPGSKHRQLQANYYCYQCWYYHCWFYYHQCFDTDTLPLLISLLHLFLLVALTML